MGTIIDLSLKDLLAGQLHEEGYFKGEISSATAKPSKDKESMNYEYTISYETGSKQPGMETREITDRFNSKAPGFMRPFLAALAGMTENEFIEDRKKAGSGARFQWEDIKGKKLQFRIQNKPREDKPTQLKSEVTEYYPYDYKVPF